MSDNYIRKAFLMSVRDDCHSEYEQRHDEIWPDLVNTLKKHGARNYSIFLESSSSKLFAYVEIEDEQTWQTIANTKVCQRWWSYMKDIMETNPDNSPVSNELKNVFFMQ
jgi:L-rhamnose mutarotase